MARKKNWLDRIKKFLTSETQSKQEKKERRRRWLFGRLKSKFSPALPPPSLQRLRSLREAEQEQSKHAVAVAVATAAAADAAVAAAQAAARVVLLTGNPFPYKKRQEVASIKIQTAFRGYLARRALKALKGLVKLQALIRGQAVRRQTNTTLKGLQSLMKIQLEARANRMRITANRHSHEVIDVIHVKKMQDRENGNPQAQYNDRRWDGSTLSKEEIIALLRKRHDAALKRERAMDYASTHQESRHAMKPMTSISDHDLDTSNPHTKLSWLENWVGAQPLHKDIHEVSASPCRDQIAPPEQLPEAESPKDEDFELMYQARRSFYRSERPRSKDDESFSSSSCFPSYMASTASAKAKFRSASTPKQRRKTLDCSEHCSLSNEQLFSPLPSLKSHLSHQRSPRLRDNFGSGKHLSINSERKNSPIM